ncbi:MAG: nucleoside deaminase [Bacteroidetes bacterium]|jgi:tRNA(adenine34) deaminase|nr:MAG: nucleoside deaminase [Bacteroidota bacterium]
MLTIQTDEHFMRQAFRMAERAFEEEETPIGAVVVSNLRIIGKGYNQTERLQDPTAHAEILAITAACEHLNSKYLSDCTLFVTIEPCPMCAGALRWAQFARVVYAAPEPKSGFTRYSPSLLHPRTELSSGVMEAECAGLMQEFFRKKR